MKKYVAVCDFLKKKDHSGIQTQIFLAYIYIFKIEISGINSMDQYFACFSCLSD